MILVRYTDGLVWLQVGGQAATDDFENRSIPQNELEGRCERGDLHSVLHSINIDDDAR